MSSLSLCLALTFGTAAPTEAVTYSRHVAPIFQRHCQECHRPGEAAPMPLFTYADARPWARSIRKHVESREMPPWHADPAHGSWQNARRMTEEEIQTVLSWVDAGSPEGDPKDLPAPRDFVEGWNIGKPDVVFKIPKEFRIKAKGEVPYQYYVVPTGFTEDRWVQAAEARPGNRAVVHHIIVFIQEPDQTGLGQGGNIWKSHLCGTAPGEGPDIFPPGTAKRIKAGSRLVFQMHYTPTGKEEVDQSLCGLVFAREPVRHEFRVQGIANERFVIPAGASAHEVKASYTLKDDSTLWAFMPHMHLRGKSFRYDLVYPDGRREIALNVPRWDFNWQHNYIAKEPLKLPSGTRIECTAVFDNSSENKHNPDPTREVRWGDQTWEEMMLGFVSFTKDNRIIDAAEGAPPPKRSSL